MAGIRIKSVKKRGFLRQIVEAGRDASVTVKDSLLSAQKAIFSPTFKSGRIVISQSGSGQSGSFQIPGNGSEWSQDNIFGLLEEFLELHDSVVAAGTSADDRDALFAAMCANDVLADGATSYTSEFGGLRCV